MDWIPPGSTVHGISQARTLEWVAFPSEGDLPNPGIRPPSPTLAGGFFTPEPPSTPPANCWTWVIFLRDSVFGEMQRITSVSQRDTHKSTWHIQRPSSFPPAEFHVLLFSLAYPFPQLWGPSDFNPASLEEVWNCQPSPTPLPLTLAIVSLGLGSRKWLTSKLGTRASGISQSRVTVNTEYTYYGGTYNKEA